MHVIDANEIFWTTFYTFDRVMEIWWKNWPDAFALYIKLLKQSRIQETNQTKSLNTFLKEWFGWWDERLKKARWVLKRLGLIDDVVVRDELWKMVGHYVRVNYIINENKIRNSCNTYDVSTSGLNHDVAKPMCGQTDTNALSIKYINAWSTKDIINIDNKLSIYNNIGESENSPDVENTQETSSQLNNDVRDVSIPCLQNEDRGVVPNLKTISKTVTGGSPQNGDTKCLVNKNKCLVNNTYISKEIGELDISPSVEGWYDIYSQLVDESVCTQEPAPETAVIPISYKLETIDMVLDIFKKVFTKHWLVVDTESKEARKYASHYVTTRWERKWQLSEKRMEIIKWLWYEWIEDFVDDILTRADTLQYWNRKAKLSSIYWVWKHKEEILNQTATKEWEHGSRENFKWYLANIVWKQSFIDVAWNKITYAPVNYSNFLVNTYWFTPVDAGEIRDEMYEWYNSKLK